jgi:hypothetical protein
MTGHPLIQTYATTLGQSFPLILVIGREPNTDLPITTNHGLYDFDRYPRCGFWNVAYSVVGRSYGLNATQVKQHFRERRASPVVFADALPIGIRQAVQNKWKDRGLLSPTAIQTHVQTVFAFEPVVSRTQIVIMSGLAAGTFAPAVEQIKEICNQHNIFYCCLPFFFGSNMPRIRAELTQDIQGKLNEVLVEFLTTSTMVSFGY